MIKLYSMPSSGNSYKVRLLLAQLEVPFEHIAMEYDGRNTKTQTDQFRAKNPTGKVPLVEFEDGRFLSESNAILHYFGENSQYLPTGKLTRAKVYQWMFFEQNFHEASVAVRCAVYRYPQRNMDRSSQRMADLLQSGNSALDVMETQLSKTDFLVGSAYSLADICLYAYTHSAEMGGFDFKDRPGIAKWLGRVTDQPGHVPLDWLPEVRA